MYSRNTISVGTISVWLPWAKQGCLFIIQIFDYFQTIADEVQYLWPARRSVMKVAYFLNRYIPFVSTGGFLFSMSNTVSLLEYRQLIHQRDLSRSPCTPTPNSM